MKTTHSLILILCVLALFTSVHQAACQGTAIIYQGQLQNNGSPANNGLYDFHFSLSNALSSGSQIGSTLTETAVGVTNGLFTIPLDFGAVFTGNPLWLAISVRSNGIGSYVGLLPLQQLAPTPSAIFAENSSNVSGTVSASQLTGVIPTSVLPGFQLPSYNSIGGGSGNTFQALSQDATIGGGQDNHASTQNTTVAGGANNTASAQNATVSGGANNIASGNGSAIGGGSANSASGATDFIGGGGFDGTSTSGNSIQANAATIGGGLGNNIPSGGTYGFIGGGKGNSIQAASSAIAGGDESAIYQANSFIGGGEENLVQADHAIIGGGSLNSIIGSNAKPASYSGIAGGSQNSISYSLNSFIGGGSNNTIYSTVTFQNGAFEPSDSGSNSVITGGWGNSMEVSADASIIGGGQRNNISKGSDHSTIGGGFGNTIDAYDAFIGGGYFNTNSGSYATLGGGFKNIASGAGATVPGGGENQASGLNSFAAGAYAQATNDNTFVWSDGSSAPFSSKAPNQFLIQASGGVGINTNNPHSALDVNGTINCGTMDCNGISVNNGPVSLFSGSVAISSSGNLTLTPTMLLDGQIYGLPNYIGGNLDCQIVSASVVTGQKGVFTEGVSVTEGGFSCYGGISCGGSVTASSFNLISDRNQKGGFSSIDSRQILERVIALPISEWNYKTDDSKRHLGPMAQDFHAAFGLDGVDDKHISVVDEGGVALAAIQGLNQKLEETEQAAKIKDGEIQELKQRLEALEKIILTQKEN